MKRGMKAAALTEVNRHIFEVAVESASAEPDWDFFCECGRSDCYDHVGLTIDEYLAIRDQGGDVLAPGHRGSHAARAARLHEEAKSLRAQAGHRMKRARRNLSEGDAH